MESQLSEHQRPGRDQTVCAWGIVLALAVLFGALEFLWPNAPLKTSDLEIATMQQTVEKKHADDNDEAARSGLRQSDSAFER